MRDHDISQRRACRLAGRDWLSGGVGQDRLTGSARADDFIFAETPLTGNADHITDFSSREGDRILLDGGSIVRLDAGQLDEANFHEGTSAVGQAAQVIYSRESGQLWFDPDGEGSAEMRLIAILDNMADLHAEDIFIL